MTNGEEHQRISVSREMLRADLAELELRLTRVINEGLSAKADASLVGSIENRVTALERETLRAGGPLATQVGEHDKMLSSMSRGDFSAAAERRITELAEDRIASETDAGWTRRERVFATIGVIVLILSFAFSVYVTSAGADPKEVPGIVTTEEP